MNREIHAPFPMELNKCSMATSGTTLTTFRDSEINMEINKQYAISVLQGILDDLITQRDLHALPININKFQERIDAITFALSKLVPVPRRRRCLGCDTNYADPPSKYCPGCQAYKEHQA